MEMYGNCGSLPDAISVFHNVGFPNNYSHNIMMKIYGAFGMANNAKAMFECIQNPDICSWTTLMTAYGQNGFVNHAMDVFDSMPHRNVVSWTSIIATCAQNLYGHEALSLFCHMQMDGIVANPVTYTCALDACAIEKDLENGQKIHASIHIQGYIIDVALGTSLLNMYGKCGSVYDARDCFSDLTHRNVASWTAMITSESDFGCNQEVLDLFKLMQLNGHKGNHKRTSELFKLLKASGVKKLDAAYIYHLHAYCKAGLLKQARESFDKYQTV